MINIMNETFALNNVVCVGYVNKNGNYEIISGRIYDYDMNFIHLDYSYDFWDLSDVVRIKREDIKYIRKTASQPLWR